MRNTHSFKMNLPEMSDPVDVRELNDNFLAIDDALMAGLCKKELTTNNMGSSDPASRKYGWAPWIEIYNGNEFDVVVIDRNAPDLPSGTINIEAGKTHRMFINGTYYMNFYVQDQHDVTFKWFTNAETRINEIEPSGGGGVSSVNVTGASGSHIESSGGPVTDTGTIELRISTGYSIPADNKQTAWDGKAVDIALSIDSSTYVMTAQLKDAEGTLIGTAKTIDLPLETMVVDGEYDAQTKNVKLELKNGNYVEFSVADLVSGLQTELSSNNKLNPTYIAYDASHRAVSDAEKDTWNSKQNAISDLDTIRSGAAAGATAVQPSEMQTALNGKQDTISDLAAIRSGASAGASAVQPETMSTALALKQDSLSETQLAAANSGVNSTKVAQIETNKTNILYTLDKTGKNLLNPYDTDVDYYDTNRGIVFTNNKDGSWHVAGTLVSGQTNAYVKLYEFTSGLPWGLQVGDVLTLATNSTKVSVTAIPITSGGYGTWVSGNATTQGTLTITSEFTGLLIRFLVETAGTVTNEDVIGMICHKEAWDQDSTIEKYGRPNYDLTQLEQQDRNALVECVDDGAKNLFNPEKATTNPDRLVTDGNGYAFKSVTDDTRTGIAFVLNAYNGNIYVRQLASAYITSTGLFSCTFIKGSDFNFLRFGHSGGTLDLQVTFDASDLEDGETYTLSFNMTATNPSVLMAWNSTMICTKAKWDVSHNFEPYSLPNTDLTQEVNALHERTDQIQEIAHLVPSTSGWYRVFAMENVATATAAGASDNSCNITIKREFVSNNNEHHEIKLIAIYPYKSEFTDEFSKSNSFLTTKIRQVVTTNSTYIDIYYAGTEVNSISCILTGSIPIGSEAARWRAINNVSAVPETTTGETIVASYDFNANDDKKAPGLNSVVMESGSLNDLSTSFIVCTGNVTDKPLDAYVWGFVRTTVSDSNTALQEFFAFSSTDQSYNGMAFVRVKQGGTWKSWKQITNT